MYEFLYPTTKEDGKFIKSVLENFLFDGTKVRTRRFKNGVTRVVFNRDLDRNERTGAMRVLTHHGFRTVTGETTYVVFSTKNSVFVYRTR